MYDFTADDKPCISYEEGLEAIKLGKSFNTHCLDFFGHKYLNTHYVEVMRFNKNKILECCELSKDINDPQNLLKNGLIRFNS